MPSEIILIAAVTVDGFIARHSNEIITWTKDLPLFKKQTMGYPIIMGSNTKNTIVHELKGREVIVVKRSDNPRDVLKNISSKKCFIVGGGKTYSRFYPFLTDIYITPHPHIFGEGVPLFSDKIQSSKLTFVNLVEVPKQVGIYQYQYKIIKT
ncbi:dihydrofolate reductase [Candidatus Marinimicrobia bacterium]|nr:dihydrofolate reductase [Candidatus Neomarinimicrobiota bacterium]